MKHDYPDRDIATSRAVLDDCIAAAHCLAVPDPPQHSRFSGLAGSSSAERSDAEGSGITRVPLMSRSLK
jgi:hypothetical protein